MTAGGHKYILGFCWDILRFFLLFALLLGDTGTKIWDGNFLILLLGISGQPVISFLWFRERQNFLDGGRDGGRFLAACRFPAFLAEVLVLGAFFLGVLPGQGEMMLLNNQAFPEGYALSVLFFICAGDLFIEIFLLFLNQGTSKNTGF